MKEETKAKIFQGVYFGICILFVLVIAYLRYFRGIDFKGNYGLLFLFPEYV